MILGIDAGIAIVGWGIVRLSADGKLDCVAYGTINTSKDLKAEERLFAIYQDLKSLLAEYKISAVAIESLFYANNQKTVMDVSQARGVILLACHGLPIYHYTPLQVKQGVTGYGKADKGQVQRMTQSLLNLASIPKPDDAADALAIAITHTQHDSSPNRQDN